MNTPYPGPQPGPPPSWGPGAVPPPPPPTGPGWAPPPGPQQPAPGGYPAPPPGAGGYPPPGPGGYPPPPPGAGPYGAGPNPYGGGPGWVGPPPPGQGPGGPGWGPTPPPKKSRTGLVLGLVGASVVLVLVVGVAAVLLTRSDGGGAGFDFGAGPGSEPEEVWAIDLASGTEDASVLSDGDRVYVVADAAEDGDDGFSGPVAVTAYAADDGDELWDAEVGSSLFDDPVRLLGDGHLLLADEEDESTQLVDAETGDEIWSADGVPVSSQVSIGFGPPIDPGTLDEVLLSIDDDDGDESIVAIDRDTGDELWEEDGGDAIVCGDVVLTMVDQESEGGELAQDPSEITARDATTGDDLWSLDAFPGLCDDGEVALGTDDDEITLVDVDNGEEGTTFDIGSLGGDGVTVAIPLGDRLVVSQYSFDEDSEARAAIYPRDGGDPVWEEDDAFAFPISDDLVIVGANGGDDVRLIRSSDGEEVGDIDVQEEDSDCDGALTRSTAVICETGSSDVTSYELDAGFEERWTVDVGVDVDQATVGGDTLFVVAGDELIALR